MADHNSTASHSFDEYAAHYDRALARGLDVTGEDRNYYARRRVEWLRRRLDRLGLGCGNVIEFGCGTGTNIPFLVELANASSVLGIDASEKSLEIARKKFGSHNARFLTTREYAPDGRADLVFCNGVFHHIPPADRASAAEYLYHCLKPGGLFALWENNPWNPGTRWVMSRIAFDKDAITLSSPQAQRLVREAGFEVLRTDFLFIFPHALRLLRRLESLLSRLAIGGQYEVLSRRPRAAS